MSTELHHRPAAGEQEGEPRQIGKYRVLGKLGEGATSEVFLCRDDFARRDVAVKRVRIAAILGVDTTAVTVELVSNGGAFGGKEDMSPTRSRPTW